MTVNTRTICAVCRSSGEAVRRIAWERCASLPNSVRSPVAKTTARPLPRITRQPAKAILLLSTNLLLTGSAVRAIGLASPVRGALLTTSSSVSTKRASAGTRMPSVSSSKSPGTKSSASIVLVFPSRITSTFGGRKARRACMAFSARYSWTKLNRALSKATPARAQPRRTMLWPV